MQCPCTSQKEYDSCCEPILNGTPAETAEQLMRARYTAYTQVNMAFIEKTHDPKTLSKTDMDANRKWAKDADWMGLEILSTEAGGADDSKGVVEFRATYKSDGKTQTHHEISDFKKMSGKWVFSEGHLPEVQQVINEGPKIGRNDPCPCGSEKKYKKCCGKS